MFDRAYFLRTAADFHKAMGLREVMLSETKRHAALGALTHVYLTATDLTDDDLTTFRACVIEFERRCLFVDLYFPVAHVGADAE